MVSDMWDLVKICSQVTPKELVLYWLVPAHVSFCGGTTCTMLNEMINVAKHTGLTLNQHPVCCLTAHWSSCIKESSYGLPFLPCNEPVLPSKNL